MCWAMGGLPLGIPRRVDRNMDLGDAAVYLHFAAATLGFDLLPHASRRPQAGTLGIKSNVEPWKWAAEQVRGYVKDPNSEHASLNDKITVAFAKVSLRVGRCRRP